MHNALHLLIDTLAAFLAQELEDSDPAAQQDDAAAAAARRAKGFSEDDQTALYMRVLNNQRQGRRGMGKSETLKIEGGCWEPGAGLWAQESSLHGGKTEGEGRGIKQGSPRMTVRDKPAQGAEGRG